MPRTLSTEEYNKRYYNPHKASGVCIGCSGAAEPNRVRCLSCSKKNTHYHKTWAAKNRKHVAAYSRMRSRKAIFGSSITQEDVDRMVEEQNGCCAVCGGKFKNTKDTNVDHDHSLADADESIRSILCNRCNLMIGQANEDPSLLRAAAEYLSV